MMPDWMNHYLSYPSHRVWELYNQTDHTSESSLASCKHQIEEEIAAWQERGKPYL